MAKQRPAAIPTKQLETDRVRVTQWNFEPGAETTWHRHAHDYVVVPLTTGKLLLESAEGEAYADLVIGGSYTRGVGVEHNVVNANDFPFSFIEIEIK